MGNILKVLNGEDIILDIKGFLFELEDAKKLIARQEDKLRLYTDEARRRGMAIPPKMRQALSIHGVSTYVCPNCGGLKTRALVGEVTIQCEECKYVWAN